MQKIIIVGNPNTGKSTLFNNITKSDEHTGNWHGVTVEAKSKIIKFDNKEFEVYDLPGLYSLNSYSYEEEVAKKLLLENLDANILYIVDANTIERNLYLFMQLRDYGFNFKILINNYKYFQKNGGEINIEKLSELLGVSCVIFDAKKDKINSKILNFNKNKINKTQKNNTEETYCEINKIIKKTLKISQKQIYGMSKHDKYLLNPLIFLFLFILGVFFSLYLIFFLLGPKLSSGITFMLNSIFRFPIMEIMRKITGNNFVLALFDEGVMSACLGVCSFLPQVCLLYVFLSLLENSGLISRCAFMLDDFLNKFGLSGKCVYTMLMGFGCNTSASVTAKNMPEKNSRIKTVMITPFMSCTAKLPIYSVILSAILGANNLLVVFGLYLLGVVVALILAVVFDKTILKSSTSHFLIEFPPLRFPEIKDVVKTSAKSSRAFLSKVFGIIVSMSVVIWILSNVSIGFRYTGNYQQSIMYIVSGKLNMVFKPLGFGSQAVVCTLIVGLVAKELVVSTMMIFNHSLSLAELIYSLTLPTSLVSFGFASGMSFLVFVLLYAPCVSNFAVMVREIGWRYSLVSILCQFVLAYVFAFITYNFCLGNIVVASAMSVFFVASIVLLLRHKKVRGRVCTGCCEECHR